MSQTTAFRADKATRAAATRDYLYVERQAQLREYRQLVALVDHKTMRMRDEIGKLERQIAAYSRAGN